MGGSETRPASLHSVLRNIWAYMLHCDGKKSVINTTRGCHHGITFFSPDLTCRLNKSFTSPVQPIFEIPFPTVSISLVITQLPLPLTLFLFSV